MAGRLSEAYLAAIEAYLSSYERDGPPVPQSVEDGLALLAEVRALQRERDEGRASFLTLFATTRRYREALVEIRDKTTAMHTPDGAWAVARAALAAPGAGEDGETT